MYHFLWMLYINYQYFQLHLIDLVDYDSAISLSVGIQSCYSKFTVGTCWLFTYCLVCRTYMNGFYTIAPRAVQSRSQSASSQTTTTSSLSATRTAKANKSTATTSTLCRPEITTVFPLHPVRSSTKSGPPKPTLPIDFEAKAGKIMPSAPMPSSVIDIRKELTKWVSHVLCSSKRRYFHETVHSTPLPNHKQNSGSFNYI